MHIYKFCLSRNSVSTFEIGFVHGTFEWHGNVALHETWFLWWLYWYIICNNKRVLTSPAYITLKYPSSNFTSEQIVSQVLQGIRQGLTRGLKLCGCLFTCAIHHQRQDLVHSQCSKYNCLSVSMHFWIYGFGFLLK